MEGAVTQQRVRTLAVVRDERGFVLSVRHARRGERFWTLPGGFSNIGESLEETLVREVGEETGYRVRVDHLAFVFEIGSSRWEPRRLELCFACEIIEEDATLRRGADGIVEVGWLNPNIAHDDFLPSKLLPLINLNTSGLYLGNITDTDHPLKK
jgi:ADP-ribose pyrophosphatase YjhB (NUDIX family)